MPNIKTKQRYSKLLELGNRTQDVKGPVLKGNFFSSVDPLHLPQCELTEYRVKQRTNSLSEAKEKAHEKG